MATVPSERHIVTHILDNMEAILLRELQTKISTDDAARLSHVQVGPPQHSPYPVAIYLYENELAVNVKWRHSPGVKDMASGVTQSRYGRPAGRLPAGRLRVGGGGEYQRTFTIEVRVAGNRLDLTTVTPSIVGDIAGVVAGRAIKALTGNSMAFAMLHDSFGESVISGPFWGEEWAVQQEGQALRIIKYLQVWFRTDRETNFG